MKGDFSIYDLPLIKFRSDKFTIHNTNTIQLKESQLIYKIKELTNLNIDDSAILLRSFKWNINHLTDSFFNDPMLIKHKYGIQFSKKINHKTKHVENAESNKIECPQCYDIYSKEELISLKCNHFSCKPCWRDYLSECVTKGVFSVLTKCNYYKCHMIVPDSFFKIIIEKSLFEKRQNFILDSFVKSLNCYSWCPSPNCKFVSEYNQGGIINIVCVCGTEYCFKCKYEPHSPTSCKMVVKWLKKSKNESQNTKWIIANTKACPKCVASIEKNQGCNHMTCQNCKHEFCWLCKEDWKIHNNTTGGYYKCNRYINNEAVKTENNIAKNDLQKYFHYYERFNNHEKSAKFAKNTLEKCKNKVHALILQKSASFNKSNFLIKAVKIVISCHLLLKWTYVFGYYSKNEVEKYLFEKLQMDLERYTDRLHELIEIQIKTEIDDDKRAEIINYTRVTEKFRDNILEGIESGLV